MTPKQFQSLKPGDIVRSKWSGDAYVVTGNYGSRVTAVQSVDITNPPEWELFDSFGSTKLVDTPPIDPRRDPVRSRGAVMNPITIGSKVRKIGGSFQHTGTVVAVFETIAGATRIVLEFDPPTQGMLHIYRPDQVEVLCSSTQ